MTIDKTRAQLLAALSELSEHYPHWRLGQTLANVAMAAGHAETSAVWDLEDDEALAAVQKLLQRHSEEIAAK